MRGERFIPRFDSPNFRDQVFNRIKYFASSLVAYCRAQFIKRMPNVIVIRRAIT